MNPTDPIPAGMPAAAGVPMAHASLLDEPHESFQVVMMRRLASLRFFTFSALIHVILLILIGGTVMFQQVEEVPDFSSDGGSLVSTQDTPQAPSDPTPTVSTQSVSVSPSAAAT